MKKIKFGIPEPITPVHFCKGFDYRETETAYPIDQIQFKVTRRGALLSFPMEEGEQFFGLGLQLKKVNLTGQKYTLRVNADPIGNTGDSHAPVPFFVSTKGYGIYIDTARYAEFYFGSSAVMNDRKDLSTAEIHTSTAELYSYRYSADANVEVLIPNCEDVEIYIFEGDTITDVVAQYNLMSGGGCDVPLWALSTIYRCYAKYHQDTVIEMAKHFAEKKLPIKTIGLEPGWQTHSYSCTYTWNESLFPRPQEMIDELKTMGMHVNLWEHAFVYPTSPIYDEIKSYSSSHKVWGGCIPDFATKEAKKIFADYHKQLVDMGIDGFKLDECDSSDFTGSWSFPLHAEFPSGMDGEQYHSMFGVLYMQAVMEALDFRPILSEVRNAGALSASYPFVLYSDLYEHRDFVRGCLTCGFSGLLWTPELRDSQSKEDFLKRLQTTVFSPQCLINAYYCEENPWKSFDCEDEVRYWLCEREKLVPLLKSAFERYKKEGVAPMRALVSDYSKDVECYSIEDEYLLGDRLLIAPIFEGEHGRRIYLPKGDWVNYFTKESVECGWFDVESDSILVYEKRSGIPNS